MKNIHVLPTDKETRLFTSDSELILAGYPATTFKTGKNIYITSDETPKLNDWFLDTIDKVVFKVTEEDVLTMELDGLPFNFKKIILTTDQYLIKDDVQAIDDEFLEWFVKNPSCEEVEVEIESKFDRIDGHYHDVWEIIIPKEEPKQETLEEASKKYALNRKFNMTSHLIGFRKGAKWQAERMYSEEEVHKILGSYSANKEVFSHKYTYDMWFEQFKKK